MSSDLGMERRMRREGGTAVFPGDARQGCAGISFNSLSKGSRDQSGFSFSHPGWRMLLWEMGILPVPGIQFLGYRFIPVSSKRVFLGFYLQVYGQLLIF